MDWGQLDYSFGLEQSVLDNQVGWSWSGSWSWFILLLPQAALPSVQQMAIDG